jgi:hypothetical protein
MLYPGDDFRLLFQGTDFYEALNETQTDWLSAAFDGALGVTSDHDFGVFDGQPVVFLDDLKHPKYKGTNEGGVPLLIPLDRNTVEWIFHSIEKDIQLKQPRLGLKKIAQLKAFANITRARAKTCIRFEPPAFKAIDLIEQDDRMPFGVDEIRGSIMEKSNSVRAVMTHFKATGLPAPAFARSFVLRGIVLNKLVPRGRSAAEVLLPVNQQQAMFNSDLLKVSYSLLHQELRDRPIGIMDAFTKKTEGFFKKKNPGAAVITQPTPSMSLTSISCLAPIPVAVPVVSASAAAAAEPPYKRFATNRVPPTYKPGTHNWKAPVRAVESYSPSAYENTENSPPRLDYDDDFQRVVGDPDYDPAPSSHAGSKRKHNL